MMENRHEESALNHSTTLTNKQRGNEATVRPATLDGESARARKMNVKSMITWWITTFVVFFHVHVQNATF